MVLVAAGCSSGISDEVHDAALEDARQANVRVGELGTAVSVAEDQLVDVEGDLSQVQADKAGADALAESLRGDADALRDDAAELRGEIGSVQEQLDLANEATAAAQDRFGDLVDLGQVPDAPAATLLRTLVTGTVSCGVGGRVPGFSVSQPNGGMTGFDADFCRAIAAAVLGDADAVEFETVSASERFNAVRIGVVDVLIRTTTWTLSRDAALGEGVDFGPTTFYDGQQLIGRTAVLGTTPGVGDVDGLRLCDAPPIAGRASAWAQAGGSSLTIVDVSSLNEALDGLRAGLCDLVTTDGSFLAVIRLGLVEDGIYGPGDLVIFPEAPFSREPLGPAYRQADTVWADIVNWVMFATIIADEKGINSSNIDSVEWDAEIRRLFGADGELAALLGLEADAFYQVIKQVGNYNEIFERNLRLLGLTREGTPNALHTNGGLIYAPPAR